MDSSATLKEARRRAGLSQRALAKQAGVPQPTVARIESGAVVPRVDTLSKLLASCGWELTGGPRAGTGVDRSSIREMLALTPTQRLKRAAREGRNLERFLAGIRPA